MVAAAGLPEVEETYRSIGSQIDYAEFVETLCERTCELFGAKAAAFSDRSSGKSWRFESGELAVTDDQPIGNVDPRDGFREGNGDDLNAPFIDGPLAYALSPLERGTGEKHQCYGWLYLYAPRAFGFEQRARFEALAAYATVVLQNIRLVEQAEALARTDILTGLPNRRALKSEMQNRLGRADAFTYVFMDVDNFKEINDKRGHKQGDIVLQQFANGLLKAARRKDYVARFGGDEFVALIEGAEADKFIQRLDVIIGRVGLACSAGQAAFPTEGRNENELWELADGRMYEKKRDTKNRRRAAVPP